MPEKIKSYEMVEGLRSGLDRIKGDEGIIGYIWRDAKSASIDIKDPSKIIDYAVLSSTALESGESVSEVFGLGEVYSVVVEGKDVKVLLVPLGNSRVSVFMKRSVDHEKVYKDLHMK